MEIDTLFILFWVAAGLGMLAGAVLVFCKFVLLYFAMGWNWKWMEWILIKIFHEPPREETPTKKNVIYDKSKSSSTGEYYVRGFMKQTFFK